MSSPFEVGILSSEETHWAFTEFAEQLQEVLDIPIVYKPALFNYVLGFDTDLGDFGTFIPQAGVEIAGDKRKQAHRFKVANVPTPETYLAHNPVQLRDVLADRSQQWVLKYPVSCAGQGHRLIEKSEDVPDNWPTPLVIQKFIEMAEPEVFRLYAVGGELFGWNSRGFSPDNHNRSPWVSHANGAEYSALGTPPEAATFAARMAIEACCLGTSFCCVDLVEDDGSWPVLEVGTDGWHGYVDRDIPTPIATELANHLRYGFWSAALAYLEQ